MAACLITQFQDQLLKRQVIRSRTEIGGAVKEGRVFFRIFFFQKVPQHLSRYDLALCGIDLPESGIQIDITEIIAQEEGKKAVHGRDLSVVKQDFLPLQVRIGRIPGKARRERPADAFPHLRSSRSGKCHNEQTIYVKGMLPLTHKPYNTLDKNCRLAAACRRRDKNIMITCIQHLLLGGRKFYRHRLSPILPLSKKRLPHQSFLKLYPGILGSKPQASL